MIYFSINKGVQKESIDHVYHLEEEQYTTEKNNIKMFIFYGAEYLGTFSIRHKGDQAEIYIPSVPESKLTKISEESFELVFREVNGEK